MKAYMNIPRIGMRNIKTALSVFLCLCLYQFLGKENPVLACVAAVICMQNTIVDSLEKGISRIAGTVMGGLVGIFVLFFVSDVFVVSEDMMFLVIPVGIVLLIELCVVFNQKQAVVISCVVYLTILISKNRDGGYVLYTVNRVIDTCIGIFVALLVNKYIVMPNWLKKYLELFNTEPADKPESESTDAAQEKADSVTEGLNEGRNERND